MNENNLIAKPSNIRNAGLGLFSTVHYSKGAIVCEYRGQCLRTSEAMKLSDKSYLMRLGENCYLDARNPLQVDTLTKREGNGEGIIKGEGEEEGNENVNGNGDGRGETEGKGEGEKERDPLVDGDDKKTRIVKEEDIAVLQQGEVKARYINDCRNINGYNVKFIKLPNEKRALVQALREIEVGEELFVDYGKWYWAAIKGTRLSNLELMDIRQISEDQLRQEIKQRVSVIDDEVEVPEKTNNRNDLSMEGNLQRNEENGQDRQRDVFSSGTAPLITISCVDFNSTYHGIKIEHLEIVESSLRIQTMDRRNSSSENSNNPEITRNLIRHRPIIFLAGDSSLDNKYWFSDTELASNGMESILANSDDGAAPWVKADVCHWLNFVAETGNINIAAINCAVEESSLGSRSLCNFCSRNTFGCSGSFNGNWMTGMYGLQRQDLFLRQHITAEDYLFVSVGGNDIALEPTLCTIINMILLMKCCSHESIQKGCGKPLPCDDPCPCCGCGLLGPACLSNCSAYPYSYGYFLHLFHTRIKAYLLRLLGGKRPKKIFLCMIYYPCENREDPSWADPTLMLLGYETNPSKLQTLICKIYQDAISQIQIPGSEIIPVPLFEILNKDDPLDYCQRVEPSSQGAFKMAQYVMSRL